MSNPGQKPTANDAFGPSLPTADEAFGTQDQSTSFNVNPFSGPVADQYASTGSVMSRMLNSVGQGAKDGWGVQTLVPSQVNKQALTKAGVKPDEDHSSLMKSVSENILRPLAYDANLALQAPARVLLGGLGAIQGLTGSTGAELISASQNLEGDKNLSGLSRKAELAASGLLGAPGELLKDLAGGALPENPVEVATQARASGAVGEGEAGFYNTRPVTPENLEARNAAAEEAGIQPPPVTPPEPDIHSIAQSMAPDTFKEYNDLNAKQAESEPLDFNDPDTHVEAARLINPDAYNAVDKLRAEQERIRQDISNRLSQLSDQTAVLQGAAPLDAGKNDAWLQGVIEKSHQKLQAADQALQDLVPQTGQALTRAKEMLADEGPQGDMFRDLVQRTVQPDFVQRAARLKELEPQILEAYRNASELLPDPNIEPSAGASGKPVQPDSTSPVSRTSQPQEPATGPSTASSEAGPRTEGPSGETVVPQGEAEPAGLGAGTMEGRLQTIQGTGETRTRGLSASLDAEAVEKGVKDTYGTDLPTYQVAKDTDQFAKVASLINTDPDRAFRVAMGQEQVPGIIPTFVLDAVKRAAYAAGDTDRILQLAKTGLAEQLTSAGQLIRGAGLSSLDPISIIQDIEQARRDAAGGLKADTQINNDVNNMRNLGRQSMQDVDVIQIAKSIECQ